MNQEIEKKLRELIEQSRQSALTASEKSIIKKARNQVTFSDEEQETLSLALDKDDKNKGKGRFEGKASLHWTYGDRVSRYLMSILEGKSVYSERMLEKLGKMDYSKPVTINDSSPNRELIENVIDTVGAWDNAADLHLINPFIAYALTKKRPSGKRVLNKTERIAFVRYFKQGWSFSEMKRQGVSKNPSQLIKRIALKLHNTPNSLLYQNGSALSVTPSAGLTSCENGICQKPIDETPGEVTQINPRDYSPAGVNPCPSRNAWPLPSQVPLSNRRMLDLRYAWASPLVREESVTLASFTPPQPTTIDKRTKRQAIANKVYSKALLNGYDARRLAYWRDLRSAIAQAGLLAETRASVA